MKDQIIELRRAVLEKKFGRMNEMQKRAVFHINGPLLVLAGAGSGKTTVLVNRIANMIRYGNAYNSQESYFQYTDEQLRRLDGYVSGEDVEIDDIPLAVSAVRPWQILAITFTNKAAAELKERLESMLGPEDANDIWAGTFHSMCARILRREGMALGYSSHFTIYDTDDSRRVMKECQQALGIDDRHLSHKVILNKISHAKDSLISPQEYAQMNEGDVLGRQIARAYELYQKKLFNADAMDFDDIIVNTVRLFQQHDDLLQKYSDRFRYIMVDEYQDTNHAQYVLVSMLAEKYRNFCVVGDDDQSIYKFRGATIENILEFEHQYPDAKVIRLEQNYRSTQNILDAANAVIANNEGRMGKNLWTANGAGKKIKVHLAQDERDEAAYITQTILNNVACGRRWSDHAVLYRMNAQSSAIEQSFVRSGVAYRMIGGHKFYDRKEIRDAIAYLCVIVNHGDAVRLRRIINEPKRGIGETSLRNAVEIAEGIGLDLFEVLKTADQYDRLARSAGKMKAFAAMIESFGQKLDEMPLHEFFEMVMSESGYLAALRLDEATYQNRLENIQELSSNLQRYSEENPDGDLVGFLEEVSLMTDIDNYDPETDAVLMMTLHSSKGLEFPVVFIPGMEEGIFPGSQSVYVPEEVEEERRLAYVGITRAKEELNITMANSRLMFGMTSRNPKSRFSREIPEELVDFSSAVSNDYAGAFSSGFTYASGYGAQGGGSRSGASSTRSGKGEHSTATRLFERKPAAPAPQSDVQFKVGDTAIHKTFGTGVVLKVTPMGNDTLLEIAFDRAGTKKLMANYARLTKPEE